MAKKITKKDVQKQIKSKESARKTAEESQRPDSDATLEQQQINIKRHLEEVVKLRQIELDFATQTGLATTAQSKALSDATKELDNVAKGFDRAKEAAKSLEDQVKGLIKKTTLIGDEWREGIIGSLLDADDAVGKIKETLIDTITPSNILGSAMLGIKEATGLAVVSFDSAQSSLAGLTGTGNAYGQSIIDVSDANKQFSSTIQDAAEAIGDLHTNMASFSRLSKVTRDNLSGLVIEMKLFGISGAETSQIMEDFTAGFGIGVEESMTLFKQTVATLNEIGLTPQQISQGFQESMPQLAHWGKDSVDIFKKVAGASKALSVEMGTLIGFASQFDTFEGAASAVGKLNAMMGGDALNTYEMMNANEAERIELLLESIELNGVVWKDMNRFEKRAIANAAGITDMAEANKVFMGGLSGYRSMQAEIEATAGSEELLADRAARAASVMKKMEAVLQKFAILVEPIVDLMHSVADAFLAMTDGQRNMIGVVIGATWLISKLGPMLGILGGVSFAGLLPAIVALGVAGASAYALYKVMSHPSGPIAASTSRPTQRVSGSSGAMGGTGGYGGGSQSGSITVVLEVDGKKMGEALAPHIGGRHRTRLKQV